MLTVNRIDNQRLNPHLHLVVLDGAWYEDGGELGSKAPVVDTKRHAYAALGMRRGLGATVGSLAAVKNAARALRKGFRQGSVQGDVWQLGGVLVVRPGGEIAYRHLSRTAGDHPPVEEVLAAI